MDAFESKPFKTVFKLLLDEQVSAAEVITFVEEGKVHINDDFGRVGIIPVHEDRLQIREALREFIEKHAALKSVGHNISDEDKKYWEQANYNASLDKSFVHQINILTRAWLTENVNNDPEFHSFDAEIARLMKHLAGSGVRERQKALLLAIKPHAEKLILKGRMHNEVANEMLELIPSDQSSLIGKRKMLSEVRMWTLGLGRAQQVRGRRTRDFKKQ